MGGKIVKQTGGRRLAAWFVIAAIGLSGGLARGRELPEPTAETAAQLGFDAERLGRIDAVVERAVAEGKVPGAVVLVGRGGGVAYAKTFGKRAVEPTEEPMTRDTIFDMASLTKPIATATSVMVLIEEGKIRLSDSIVKYFPELDNHGKGRITVDHLLRHRAGLIPDNALGDYKDGPEAAWKQIAELQPVARPGSKFIYSDVGFIILGKLVEKVSGKPLDEFADERVFGPAGMVDAHFRPTAGDASNRPPLDRVAPTEKEGDAFVRGVVHDPRSRALGGVAGHAGLFATADDVANFARMLLYYGAAPSGYRVLAPLTVRLMRDPADTPAGQRRGLGWDVETGFSSPKGELFGPSSFGHTGFTGTSVWIDPETQTFVVILTSRLHPKSNPSPSTLRRDVATLAAAALVDPPAVRAPASTASDSESSPAPTPFATVTCGIDVLAARGFDSLKGKRVGLVTNHTGRSADGRSTIDVLFAAPDVKLVKLFSPEHGIRGLLDHEKITSGVDEATKLPVVSLYEGKKRKPQDEDLADLDVLVYDIQDIGVRYYTYASTLGLVLEAAKANGKKLVVLDRPNAIGGVDFGGPVRDESFESFVAYHAIPIRHGMTVGELARLYNAERKIEADLEVVPCEGWTRGAAYDRTGLLWVNPSPNMRSLTEALLYPGVGWLEGTNLATGRGTDTPFERVGAPWIKPVAWARSLDAQGVPGVSFTPLEFSPTERQYKGETCGGVQIQITDRAAFDPIKLGLALALTLRRDYKDDWKPERMPTLLCDEATYQAILDLKSRDQIEALWTQELADFGAVRERYLIYPE
ncbi:exo-beta-N-acetylmuramidase NamZ domain-containing protein [Planctomyces sp. SH-PL62]|uniref:exo-beta-N-acetylmuramidase NamZ domain-containing protein n=1 Tax=Planctomyces sp. SH-PL62 TaxID=1636152 RepID=UPI00078BA52B|nr:exo-beta-N-acetylmuramidase NamZ domain-containing protein [Planctomyces sp. SH-PL62]AMV39897.1 Penicillin-binding protein 4* [Planctomyces sp. SH-PL62]